MNKNDYETGLNRDERYLLNKIRMKKIEIIERNNQPECGKQEDSLIKDLIESSAADFSKLENDSPYPYVWDKDLNFIGHKVIEDMWRS
jgi:hypothetical protein